MKIKTQPNPIVYICCSMAIALLQIPNARSQYHIGERVWSTPTSGMFYSSILGGTTSPPYPYFPFDPVDVPLYFAAQTNAFVFDDTGIELIPPPSVPDPPGGGGTNGGPIPFHMSSYGTNDLWLEIFPFTNTVVASVPLLLHGVKTNYYYQLHDKTDLSPQIKWRPGEIKRNDPGTNQLAFSPVAEGGPVFFRAAEGFPVLHIFLRGDAIEPHGANEGQVGQFGIQFTDFNDVLPTNLTIHYSITGYVNSASAENGQDYETISSSIVMPSNSIDTTIFIDPKEDSFLEFCEFVTITLIQTNGYLVAPNGSSATLKICDFFETNLFSVVATNLDTPAGIGYHPVTNSLIVSVNSFTNSSINFIRIDTNGVISPWSGANGLFQEKKLSIVPSTANGFNQGDIYFGTDNNGVIGWISANGTAWTNRWAVLTTNATGSESLLRGGLHFDRSGSFEGDLIAVTGGTLATEGGEVWRINSSGESELHANITNTHLEGALTLTNSPFAGKILTGAESAVPPLLYTIATNKVIEELDLGIKPEDFDIIITNQNLYCVDQGKQSSAVAPQIVKLSRSHLINI